MVALANADRHDSSPNLDDIHPFGDAETERSLRTKKTGLKSF